MENTRILPEPLRINNSGKYELYDYVTAGEIAIASASLFEPHFDMNLNTTIKIIRKEDNIEFDRFMLMAFRNPMSPKDEKIYIKEKFFNPKKYYLKIETRNGSDDINFLLYFSTKGR